MSSTSVPIPPPVTDNGQPLPSQGSDFGPNVLIFNPSTASSIQSQVDNIFQQQQSNQFGTQRYALLFQPGSYEVNLQVGFYTTVCGLGSTPDAVTITGGVNTTASWFEGNATQNFWRGVENLAVIPTVFGSDAMFATSQGTWLRRVHIRGSLELYDFSATAPGEVNWSSGGFIADSVVDTSINSGSQQQYLLRNSNPTSWTGQGWNMVFLGDVNTPNGDDWPSTHYTVIPNTPVIREKPYLTVDTSNNYSVVVPSLKTNSQGPSWTPSWNNTGTNLTPSNTLPLSDFYIAQASQDTANTINIALQRNMHLILTPGVYTLSEPIVVRNPNTVVLGLGLATLSPTNGTPALIVADVDGVTIAGLIFDAGTSTSPNLLQFGDVNASTVSHSANPTVTFDITCRVGGPAATASTQSCVVVNSCNVILDNTWLWRADHAANPGWTGWTINPSTNGLIVNSDNVSAYGLFVEHHQGYQTLWNGNGGTVLFYQSEEPYDVPNQAAWTQNNENGYPSYKISENVTSHLCTGLGVYCFFTNPVELENAIESPPASQIDMQRFFTLFLGGNASSSITHLVNGGGNAVSNTNMSSFSAS